MSGALAGNSGGIASTGVDADRDLVDDAGAPGAHAQLGGPRRDRAPLVEAAPGWLACRSSTRHLLNGTHDEDFEIWDSSGQLVAQARQLALLATS